MLDRLQHRGPDNSGHYSDGPTTLGHNRLSIIDLDQQANQPMEYDGLIITYNGEIYNYLELKSELKQKGYQFSTESDTEVILVAYKAWGKNCVEQFIGMWSFAIWDKHREELFCSRDRFGIKPFFFIHYGQKFYFASEAKALKDTPLFSNDINPDQVSIFLQLGWLYYENNTLFKNIQNLPAAHNLTFKNGQLRVWQYWDLENEIQPSSSQQDLNTSADTFQELFLNSMKLHQRSDVEVGGCLSGGLDSSAIASSFCYLNPEKEFKTFTIYYSGKGEKEIDESPWAKEVIRKYPNINGHFYSPSDEELTKEFNNYAYHMDFPSAGSSPFSQYFLMRLANKHNIKVLIDGQGADEFLGGYHHSFYRFFGDYLRKGKFSKFYQQFSSYNNLHNLSLTDSVKVMLKTFLSTILSEQHLYSLEYKKLLPFLYNESRIPFHLEKLSDNKFKNFLLNLIGHTNLPNLLHNEDRNSMAFSIESRVPFLDHRLVSYALQLPNEHIIDKGVTKKILRNGLNSINPSSITKRMDKKGFITPGEVKWLRGPLKDLVTKDYSHMDFLNSKKAKEITNDYLKGNNKNAKLVWRLSTLNHWLKTI